MQRGSMVVYEPVVIFEVISKGTAHTDRMVKNREYAGTASVRRYIMLEQTGPEGMMFTRSGEAAEWLGQIIGAETILHMPEIGIELPLAELYANIDLASPDTDEG